MTQDEPDFAADGMFTCASCDGWFFPEDMDGDHCRCCAGDLFEEEE